MKRIFQNSRSIRQQKRANRWQLYYQVIIALSVLIFSTGANAFVAQKDRVATTTDARIVGGTQVPSGQRTYQVSLQDSQGHFCGGSIIADSWVLTAAHCVDSSPPTKIVSGTQNLTSGGQSNTVAQIITHPKWSSNSFGTGSDVALVKINGTFATNLERLQLATPELMSSSATPGVAGVVSGWGLTSGGGSASNQLLQTNNTIISDAECSRLAQGGTIDGSIVICANDVNQGSCNGDSGGPYTINSGGVDYSIGIVSFGPQSCDGYSAYTETAAFKDWIESQINGGGGGGGGGGNNTLQNNQAVTISGARGEDVYYTFTLPSGVTQYTVSISGGSGDADLYVKQGSQPTDQSYDCRPYLNGNNESCSANNPSAGTYHVRVTGYSAFSNVSLLLSYTGGSGDPGPTPPPGPTPDPNTCPAGFTAYNGIIANDGMAVVGGDYYYAPTGQHNVLNVGNSVMMELYRWTWGSWSRIRYSTSQISYSGRSGYYAIVIKGTPGGSYSVCAQTP